MAGDFANAGGIVKASAIHKIETYGLDAICEDISNGISVTDIAAGLNVARGSLLTWIASDPDRSARVRATREDTAALWDEKAEKALQDATDAIEVQKARELAQHYRWRASKIAPRTYGDKVEINGGMDIKVIPDDRLDARLSLLLGKIGIAAIAGGEGPADCEATALDLLSGPGTAPA